jgi:hypothetical protein
VSDNAEAELQRLVRRYLDATDAEALASAEMNRRFQAGETVQSWIGGRSASSIALADIRDHLNRQPKSANEK